MARLNRVVARANAGNKVALAELRSLLDEHEAIWRHVGDLASTAERAWIAVIAGGNQLVAESILRQLAEIRAELCGPHPTRTERLLVDQVAAAWLALQHAELDSARDGTPRGQEAIRLRRLDCAQRRYLGALKLLTLLREKMTAGLAPINAFHVVGRSRQA